MKIHSVIFASCVLGVGKHGYGKEFDPALGGNCDLNTLCIVPSAAGPAGFLIALSGGPLS